MGRSLRDQAAKGRLRRDRAMPQADRGIYGVTPGETEGECPHWRVPLLSRHSANGHGLAMFPPIHASGTREIRGSG